MLGGNEILICDSYGMCNDRDGRGVWCQVCNMFQKGVHNGLDGLMS